LAKTNKARLADFQFAGAPAAQARVAPAGASRGFDLPRIDPAAQPFSPGDPALARIKLP